MSRSNSCRGSLVAFFLIAGTIGAIVGESNVAVGGASQSGAPSSHGRPVHKVSHRGTAAGSLVPAPTPTVGTMPSSEQVPYVGPPYISESAADGAALQVASTMGPGPQVVAAKLESLSSASSDVGQQVGTFAVTSSRMVWLVWVVGPYEGPCISSTCSAPQSKLYYLAVDATSGQVFAGGTSVNAPAAPAGLTAASRG